MTEVQSELLQYQISHDLKLLIPYRATRVRILSEMAQLDRQLRLTFVSHSPNEITLDLRLQTIQRDAAERWLAYALTVEQAVTRGETTFLSKSVVLFDGFRRANRAFDDHLVSERNSGRSAARTASRTGIVLMFAGTLVTAVVMLVFGLRFTRSISKPIIDLNDTMKRQRAGDLNARAKENQGSLETMSMAHEFNVLIERQIGFQQTQERALHMHELAAEIGLAVRNSSSVSHSLEFICKALGEGLGADRVMANTADAYQKRALAAQWHIPDVPPLGNLPDELVPHLGEVDIELWQSSSYLVSNDRVAPEAQTERVRLFYSYTDARAAIVVPIGLGDQVVGTIYVITVNESRQWAVTEINAVRRVAELLAHSIIEDSYRTQQIEQIEVLTRLDRQKANFVATVSHELRTPLTSIIGYLEVLKDGYAGELVEEQSRLVEVINRNASRLLGLINDLLTLTQSENGGLTDDVADVSISELITESCQELPPIVHSDAVKLEIDAGPSAAIVRGDRGQLKSVIVNIVANAIKFSRPGGVVTIRCTLDEETNRIRIIVEDRGIGIPAADQKELFTRFYRASNATAKFIPGTGLGLSIVKQIVNDHGGEVQLKSVEDEGTTVTVDLPLAVE
jgi:signal transduction histidine kinase